MFRRRCSCLLWRLQAFLLFILFELSVAQPVTPTTSPTTPTRKHAADDERFLRGVPAPAKASDLCMKDVLIILDTSLSVQAYFERNMKPFLKELVTDNDLRVSRVGTQIALMIFSEKKKTEVLLDFGKIYDADKLAQFIDKLNWDDIKGGFTRTDLAFQMASDKVLTQKNPKNNRPDVEDVVVIITDGDPYGVDNVLEKTMANASVIKEKGIQIVGAAVGNEEVRAKLRPKLEAMATSAEFVVEADFKDIKTIRSMLISKTCTKPAHECLCHSTISKTYQIKAGQSKATATWPVPQYSCNSGGTATMETMLVEPNVRSPRAFPRGDHIIKYTFKLEGGVDVVCLVTIIVRGKMCGDKAFDSCKQDCCCGTIHDHRPGFKCCGPKYYNPADYKCCDYAYLVSSQESCPIY